MSVTKILEIHKYTNTNAAFDAFADAYLCFLVSASAKKNKKKNNAEVIQFLGILKKYVSNNKKCFCSRKKSNFLLNKKVIFVFHTILKLDFITQIIYCIIHRCLCFYFIFFPRISVCKKWNIETMLTFRYSYNWQKLTTTK